MIIIAALDVPPRRNVHRDDRQAGARDERERSVERSAGGRLEREAEYRVQHNVARRERRRERVLRQLWVFVRRGGQRRDVHVRALRVQALLVVSRAIFISTV